MLDLLTRTVSQGLQGVLPVAFALAWYRHVRDPGLVTGIKWGAIAAAPVTVLAVYLFRQSTRQSLWEAGMAGAALVAACWFLHRVSLASSRIAVARITPNHLLRAAVAIGVTILIVRQAMEIGVTLWAVVELRARDPLVALLLGTASAIAAGAAWLAVAPRIDNAALLRATRIFAMMFTAQAAMYLLHESAESGLLPWSEPLHAATEPYGPDGVYGRYFSLAVFIVPIVSALATRVRAWRYGAVVAAALVIVGVIELGGMRGQMFPTIKSVPATPPPPTAAAIVTGPHLVFRHAAVDPLYGRLSVTPLAAAGTAPRASAAFKCERVSYAGGHGLCLTTELGVFAYYKAIIFDRSLTATHTIRLSGSPTRTRVSPDGRVGAVTVFDIGTQHTYSGSSFSTKTTFIDLKSGDDIGDLESFAAWRDGKRIKARDFNFWGVTFARDSDTFYATLKTGGTTYLVRGELGLRKVTVLHSNVECPALSPDNRLVGFKKRVGTGAAPWRLYVLDLTTMTERPIAGETRSIDDQLEWLDNEHVLYGVPRAREPSNIDIWIADVDGGAPARLYLKDAESPIVVR